MWFVNGGGCHPLPFALYQGFMGVICFCESKVYFLLNTEYFSSSLGVFSHSYVPLLRTHKQFTTIPDFKYHIANL